MVIRSESRGGGGWGKVSAGKMRLESIRREGGKHGVGDVVLSRGEKGIQ